MFDLEKLMELGLTGIALIAIVGLVDLVRRRYRSSPNGDRRKLPIVIECPNRIEGLGATLKELAQSSRAMQVLVVEQVRILQHNSDGIDRLIEDHAPNAEGRQTWKGTKRQEEVAEESVKLLRELVTAVEKNGR